MSEAPQYRVTVAGYPPDLRQVYPPPGSGSEFWRRAEEALLAAIKRVERHP